MASKELHFNVHRKLQFRCRITQPRAAQGFFTIYTENRSLAVDACSNGQCKVSLKHVMKIVFSELMHVAMARKKRFLYTLKITVSPFMYAATVNTELLYNIYREIRVSSLLHAATAHRELFYEIT